LLAELQKSYRWICLKFLGKVTFGMIPQIPDVTHGHNLLSPGFMQHCTGMASGHRTVISREQGLTIFCLSIVRCCKSAKQKQPAAMTTDEPVPLKAVANRSSESHQNDVISACSNGAASGHDSSMHFIVNGHGAATDSANSIS